MRDRLGQHGRRVRQVRRPGQRRTDSLMEGRRAVVRTMQETNGNRREEDSTVTPEQKALAMLYDLSRKVNLPANDHDTLRAARDAIAKAITPDVQQTEDASAT